MELINAGNLALLVSIVTFILCQRSLARRASVEQVERVESEIQKLRTGLDKCIRERISLKEALKRTETELGRSEAEVVTLRQQLETR